MGEKCEKVCQVLQFNSSQFCGAAVCLTTAGLQVIRCNAFAKTTAIPWTGDS